MLGIPATKLRYGPRLSIILFGALTSQFNTAHKFRDTRLRAIDTV